MHHQVPDEEGQGINIFDDDMWDELTGKRILRDMTSPMTAAGINPVADAVSSILKTPGVHMAEGFAHSALSPISLGVGVSKVFAPFGTGTGITDAFSGITSVSDHSRKIAMSTMAGFAGLNIGKTFAEYSASMTGGLQPIMGRMDTVNRWQGDLAKSLAPALVSKSAFTMPASFFDQIPSVVTGIQRLADQQRQVFDGIAKALRSYDLSGIQKLNRNLLPPNLRELADEINFSDVREFLREEAIPLYLVPRARTALRFLRAADRPVRRQILNACFESLVEDCEEVLEQVDHPEVETEAEFALNGVAALRDGHERAAQALFTLIFDTLISRFYPDKNVRMTITNRKADVPEIINGMGYRDVSMWLPVWNAHGKFHPKPGAPVPWQFSRHATVHKVSRKQYSQRNTVQSLMLVTSLIGHANRLRISLP
ncbi:hypothetical protein [Corynebacterium sp.]|mgnify:CR=1 FL=1|uniref:hypothetical protein n=1 Tax=Corynebacterium sp. TaxID=1720 RepID=UPI0025C468E6|nr:hypothetical protein [Corynebacterium sp.]